MLNCIKFLKWEIFLFFIFILYRLPYLKFDTLNSDAPVWKQRIFEFSSAFFSFNFRGTAVTYHPGVVLVLLGSMGVKFHTLLNKLFNIPRDLATVEGYTWLDFSQKLMIVIFLAFVLSVCLFLIKNIYGGKISLLFFFLFTFEPFVLALTRVLHTDGLVTILSFLAVLSAYYYIFKQASYSTDIFQIKRYLWLVISGVATGWALLTKSNSLFLLGFVGLEFFVLSLSQFLQNRSKIFLIILSLFKDYFLWLLIVVSTFFLFWPAMWVSPVDTLDIYIKGITNIGFEEHWQGWFGVEVNDPGGLFYPVILLIRFTPWFVILCLAGILSFFYSILKYKKVELLQLISLLYIVLYILILSIPEKKLSRYVLPTIPFFALFGVYYLDRVINFVLKWNSDKGSLSSFWHKIKLNVIKSDKYARIADSFRSNIYYILSIIFLFLSILSTWKFVPEYLMYYSPLVFGYDGGKNIEEPQWPLGYRKLALIFNEIPYPEERRVFVRYGYLFNPLYIGPVGSMHQDTEKDFGAYFALEKYSDWRYLKGKGVELTNIVKLGDTDYFWIYKILGNYNVTKEYDFYFPTGLRIDPRF